MYVGLTSDQRFLPGELGMGLVEGRYGILYVLPGAGFQTHWFRLQLHGLWDVQAKPAGWVGGRPEARVWGQEGQMERAAAPHPEIQDCFHRVSPEGKEVGDFLMWDRLQAGCCLTMTAVLVFSFLRLDEALSAYLGTAQEMTEEQQQDMEIPLPIRKCPQCGRDMVLKKKREGNGWGGASDLYDHNETEIYVCRYLSIHAATSFHYVINLFLVFIYIAFYYITSTTYQHTVASKLLCVLLYACSGTCTIAPLSSPCACSKYLTCVGYPACKSAVWFPDMVLEVSRDGSVCPTCQPAPVHMWVKINRMWNYIYFHFPEPKFRLHAVGIEQKILDSKFNRILCRLHQHRAPLFLGVKRSARRLQSALRMQMKLSAVSAVQETSPNSCLRKWAFTPSSTCLSAIQI